MGERDKYTHKENLGRGSKFPWGSVKTPRISQLCAGSEARGLSPLSLDVDWGVRKKGHCCIP